MHRQQGAIYRQRRRLKDGTLWVSPNYTIAYYVGARLKREVVGPRKKAATRLLGERLKALHDGTYREIQETTFKDYVEKWTEGLSAIKPSSREAYQSIIEAHLKPAFGDMALSAIGVPEVNAYLAARQETLKPKTLRNHLVLLHKLFGDATESGYLAVNRIHGSRALRRPKAIREDDEPEIEILTPEEVGRLLGAVERHYAPLFLTAALTGMRLGELLGLQWGDIDWDARRIFVRRTLFRGEFYRPKTRQSRRAIDVGQQLLAILGEMKLARHGPTPPRPDDLVFTVETGTCIDPDNLRHRVWEPAFTRAKLRHVRIHSLRHFFASQLIQNGENVKYISAQLGHASAQISLDRYGHLFPSEKRTAAARLEACLREGIQNIFRINGAKTARKRPDDPGMVPKLSSRKIKESGAEPEKARHGQKSARELITQRSQVQILPPQPRKIKGLADDDG